jgi:hypothetical protein
MRKLLAVMAVGLLIGGPAAAAGNGRPTSENLAEHPALYGLCTAYFSGQGGEHGNKNSAPPFVALQEAADDGDSNTSDDVEQFCSGVRPSNGQGGGSGNSNAPDPVR